MGGENAYSYVANPISRIDPLGLNEVCPGTEAGKGTSGNNLSHLTVEQQQLIKNAENGFILIFSKDYFPDTDLCLEWQRSDNAGNWYYSKEFDTEGWLCPAIFKYFTDAPKNLYIKVKDI